MTCSLLYYTTYRTTGNFSFLTFFKNRTDEGCSFPRNWCNMVNWVGLNRWLTLFMVLKLISKFWNSFSSKKIYIYIYIRKNKRSLKWIWDTKIFQILSIRFSIKITYLLSRAHTIYHEERFFFKREKERLRCFERKLGRSTMSVNLLENYTARETVIKVLIKIMFAYDRSPSMRAPIA